jgi:hypothetical protein
VVSFALHKIDETGLRNVSCLVRGVPGDWHPYRDSADYYSSLSPEEAGEQVKWVAYALGEFPGEAR